MSFLFQPSPALPSCHPAGLAHPPPPSTPVHFLQADFILDFRAGREGGEGDICPPGPLAFEAFCGLPAAPCSAAPLPLSSADRHWPTLSAAGLCSCASSDEGSFPGPRLSMSAQQSSHLLTGAFLGHHLQPLLRLLHSEFGIFFFFFLDLSMVRGTLRHALLTPSAQSPACVLVVRGARGVCLWPNGSLP